MKIKIGVPAYNAADYLRKLIFSSQFDSEKHEIRLDITTHSDDQDTYEAIYDGIVAKYPIDLFSLDWNRGIAKTWNDIQIRAFVEGDYDVCIICNDDVYFSPGDIDIIARKAVANRGNYMVSVAGHHDKLREHRVSHGYSCFAINPIALEKIGCLDEQFWPAYMEDIDHHRRATMLGLVEENCPNTSVTHGGSMTLTNDQILSLENMVTQSANIRYFRRKWDSDSHEDGYSNPFNDPKFGLKIEIEDRHNPYPGYERDDIRGGSND